ncbi:hypothetical protein [Corallincola spongiicola]|uniref:Uncharacterized protein n=1 Tax=Corallincola spongiicola TaxID=2520508 RepID=A0ABY1WQY5_9GAMM|nr:hypothetical protein [Corallincola spongiicola]TAA47123.1 hypothetical protein EXY25_07725 [Corallincola spongiicola]
MYLQMNGVDLKPAAIMLTACLLIGSGIQYFTGFYWLTATLLVMVAVLINGLIMFNEDLDEGGFNHQEGVTDTPEAKAEQGKANKIQLAIIVLLIIGAVWSYI